MHDYLGPIIPALRIIRALHLNGTLTYAISITIPCLALAIWIVRTIHRRSRNR